MPQFLGQASLEGQFGSTLRYRTDQGSVELTLCTPRIARLRLVDDRDWPSYVGPRDWPAAPLRVEAGDPTVATAGELTLRITTDPLRVTFGDAAGNVLVRQGGLSAVTGQGTGTTTTTEAAIR
jgi:hypothetical protein